MRIQLVSDLHLEFYYRKPLAETLASLVPQTDAKVLVIAGDLSSGVDRVQRALEILCDRYEHVVYVPGNHEYYGTQRKLWWRAVSKWSASSAKSVAVLDDNTTEIDGVSFVGSTLWFPDVQVARHNTRWMSDFWEIRDAGEWIWGAHEKAREFLAGALTPGCVLVTHHLPTPRSIHPRYEGEVSNCYFLGDISDLLEKHRPAFALHGHTHEALDYDFGATRVVCNPSGYPAEIATRNSRGPVVLDTEPNLFVCPTCGNEWSHHSFESRCAECGTDVERAQ